MTLNPVPPPSTERELPIIPALLSVMLVSVLAITALLFFGPVVSHIQCDGTVPTWMVATHQSTVRCETPARGVQVGSTT